jgi:hypothetical protein
MQLSSENIDAVEQNIACSAIDTNTASNKEINLAEPTEHTTICDRTKPASGPLAIRQRVL